MATLLVGVRDLRHRLSHFLGIAKAGRTVTITERGRVIAHLVPAEADLGRRLDALRSAGLITWSGRRLMPAVPVTRLRGKKQVADLVSEMRE